MIRLNNSGVEYIDSTHQYLKDGKELKGITGLLHKYVFPDMYNNVDKETLRKAAERGTMIHEQVELVVSLGVVPSLECVKAFKDLLEKEGYEAIESEYVLAINEDHASAIDLVVHKVGAPDDEVEIWDIKGTYSVNKEYVRWQDSIYKVGFEKLNPNIKVIKIRCMWLRDDVKRGTICRLIDLGEPRSKEDVDELFRCEKEDRLYDDNSKTPSYIAEADETLADIEDKIARLTEQRDALKEKILTGMIKDGLAKYKTSNYTYSAKDGLERKILDRESFDEEAKKVYNDLVQKYSKTTKTKQTLQLRRIDNN